jgi:hypothetical protein
MYLRTRNFLFFGAICGKGAKSLPSSSAPIISCSFDANLNTTERSTSFQCGPLIGIAQKIEHVKHNYT